MNALLTILRQYWIALTINALLVAAGVVAAVATIDMPNPPQDVTVVTDPAKIKKMGKVFVTERISKISPRTDAAALNKADESAPLSRLISLRLPETSRGTDRDPEDVQLLDASDQEIVAIIRDEMRKCPTADAKSKSAGIQLLNQYEAGLAQLEVHELRSAQVVEQPYSDEKSAGSGVEWVEALLTVTNDRNKEMYPQSEISLVTEDGSLISGDYVYTVDRFSSLTAGETASGVLLFRVADSKLDGEIVVVANGSSIPRHTALAIRRGACLKMKVQPVKTVGDHPRVTGGELVDK